VLDVLDLLLFCHLTKSLHEDQLDSHAELLESFVFALFGVPNFLGDAVIKIGWKEFFLQPLDERLPDRELVAVNAIPIERSFAQQHADSSH
jgi:hypothetical protein